MDSLNFVIILLILMIPIQLFFKKNKPKNQFSKQFIVK